MRIALFAVTIVLAVLPWVVVLYDLPSVRMWRVRRRTRRTTREMWARHPEARPAHGHPPVSAPDRRGRAMTPATVRVRGVVAGVRGVAS